MTGHDLFSAGPGTKISQPAGADTDLPARQPLAARMRPRHLDEFAGQSHILAAGQLLRRAIEADRDQSLIFAKIFATEGTDDTDLF